MVLIYISVFSIHLTFVFTVIFITMFIPLFYPYLITTDRCTTCNTSKVLKVWKMNVNITMIVMSHHCVRVSGVWYWPILYSLWALYHVMTKINPSLGRRKFWYRKKFLISKTDNETPAKSHVLWMNLTIPEKSEFCFREFSFSLLKTSLFQRYRVVSARTNRRAMIRRMTIRRMNRSAQRQIGVQSNHE